MMWSSIYYRLTAIACLFSPPTWTLRVSTLRQDSSRQDTLFQNGVLFSGRSRSLLECASTCALKNDRRSLTFWPQSTDPGQRCTCYTEVPSALAAGAAAPSARFYSSGENEESPETTESPDTTESPVTTESPETTEPPETTESPVTSESPETTQTTTVATCPSPPPVSDASYKPVQSQYVTNDVVIYACSDEQDGGGDGRRVCNSQGQWQQINADPDCD